MNDAIRMQVSAYVDGELPDNEAELLIRRMSQDVELRQEVAKYLAIGRLIRAEPGLGGADRLHERVADAIDDRPTGVHDVVTEAPSRRAIRPLAGAAIAASVALVAIFALQQTSVMDELPADQAVPVVSGAVPSIDAQQERQRQFFLNHAETSSQYGANGMNSRVVTLRFSEEITQELEAEETTQRDEDLEPANESVTQP